LLQISDGTDGVNVDDWFEPSRSVSRPALERAPRRGDPNTVRVFDVAGAAPFLGSASSTMLLPGPRSSNTTVSKIPVRKVKDCTETSSGSVLGSRG
jgi:hypothetical protein